MVLDVFALIVLGVVIAAVIWLVVLLGTMPGNVAYRRGHPQTAAIRVLGWIGIVTLGPAWFAALVWAYTKPGGTAGVSMTFVSDEIREVVASFSQSAGRYVQVGDTTEVVFSRVPGRVFTGKVKYVMDTTGTAQLAPSGQLPVLSGQPSAGRYPVRIVLDESGTDALVTPGGRWHGCCVHPTRQAGAYHHQGCDAYAVLAWLPDQPGRLTKGQAYRQG